MGNLIAASEFCVYHDVEYNFISMLEEAGLVEVTIVDETTYIPESELQKLERMIRLHNELEINVAGIDAISHLLQRLDNMREEMNRLRNRLRMEG